MKRFLLFLFLILFFVPAWSKETKMSFNPYSQLIGMTAGGEYFFLAKRTYGNMGVFFETVVESWIGIEMHILKSGFPITNQDVSSIGGQKDFLETGTALRFYMPFWQPLFVELGFNYNEFLSGYTVAGATYTRLADVWQENFFSGLFGFGLTAQISSDLFSQVGIRANAAINGKDYGLRIYLNFAYGL